MKYAQTALLSNTFVEPQTCVPENMPPLRVPDLIDKMTFLPWVKADGGRGLILLDFARIERRFILFAQRRAFIPKWRQCCFSRHEPLFKQPHLKSHRTV